MATHAAGRNEGAGPPLMGGFVQAQARVRVGPRVPFSFLPRGWAARGRGGSAGGPPCNSLSFLLDPSPLLPPPASTCIQYTPKPINALHVLLLLLVPRASTTQARGAEHTGPQACIPGPVCLPRCFMGYGRVAPGGGDVVWDVTSTLTCTCLYLPFTAPRARTGTSPYFSLFFWRGDTRRIHASVKDCTRANEGPEPHRKRKSSGLVSGRGPRVPRARMGRAGERATQGKAERPPPPLPRFLDPSAGSCVLRLGAGGLILGRLCCKARDEGDGGRGRLDLLVGLYDRAGRLSTIPYASGRHTVR